MDLHNIDTGDPTLQILALDGGGLRGIFSAAALDAWEEDFDTSISDHFDLIVGTSTGGIIALALGLGMRPREILSLYIDNAERIFPGASALRWVRRRKYPPDELRKLLEGVFGTSILADSKVRLAIPSYDLATDDVHLFRTPHHVDLRRDWRETVVDVAMATAAAPSYLPVANVRSHRFTDGGVWANNPTMVGIVEAVDRLGGSLGRIRVLSVGTTAELKERDGRLDQGGLWAWRRDALAIALRGQSLAATNYSRLLLGREKMARLDVPISPGRHLLDSVNADDLVAKASAASRRMSPKIAHLFQHIPLSYEPIHTKESGDDGQ